MPSAALPRREPRGFTILESIIALLLVNVAIVALMSATAVTARAALAARYRAAALRMALNRIEWLSASACVGSASQGDTAAPFAPGAVERWRASAPTADVRELWDSVGYAGAWRGRGADTTRWIALHTRILC